MHRSSDLPLSLVTTPPPSLCNGNTNDHPPSSNFQKTECSTTYGTAAMESLSGTTLAPNMAAVSFSGEHWSKIKAVRVPNPFSSRTAFTSRVSAAPVTYGTKIWARPDCWSAETRSSWPGWNTTPEGCSRERRERTFCLRR